MYKKAPLQHTRNDTNMQMYMVRQNKVAT